MGSKQGEFLLCMMFRMSQVFGLGVDVRYSPLYREAHGLYICVRNISR